MYDSWLLVYGPAKIIIKISEVPIITAGNSAHYNELTVVMLLLRLVQK